MNDQTLSQCFKRVEFVISVGASRRQEVQEKWIYDCEFQVCAQTEMFLIEAPTPCACGMKWAMPLSGNVNGPVDRAYDVSLHSARSVVYHRRTRQEIMTLEEYNFVPNGKTTQMLRQLSDTEGLANWTTAFAGFSGFVEPFDRPALLDTNVPGQEDHVPALCFTVLQSYQSDYKWPEPPFPNLHSPPNVYMTDCAPFNPDGATTPFIHFRDIYLFSDESTGPNRVHRYLTSYYRNSLCQPEAGYVTIEREFTSFLRRAEKPGCFRWSRRYIRNWLIGGVPWDFGTMDYYYEHGDRNVTYWQGYSRQEVTCEVDPLYGVDVTCSPNQDVHNRPVLHNALLGLELTGEQAGSVGPLTKLCDAVPAEWGTCSILADNNCGKTNYAEATFNADQQIRWPLPSPGVSNPVIDVLDCPGVFELCESDETYMCYQNFGVTDRDFTKSQNSWLVTGERILFCGIVQDSALDALKAAPVHDGQVEPNFNLQDQRRKRHSGAQFSALHNDPSSPNFHDELAPRRAKRDQTVPRTFIRKRGVLEETEPFVDDPPASGIPQQQPGVSQFATGSADPDGLPAGDHPVQLFPETYTLPVSMDPADTACGTYPGDYITSGCGAKQYNGFPPCIEGQLGCSCRNSPGRPQCDLPYECRGGGFCVKPQCPLGAPGCRCNAGACDGDHVLCNSTIDRCYYEVSICPPGQPGCPCARAADGVYDSCEASTGFVCMDGVCKNPDRVACTDGTGGCVCSGTTCQQSRHACSAFGECVSAAFCEAGSPGCTCASGGRCSTEMVCDEGMNHCVQPECPAGDEGCPCKSDCGCNKPGYACEFLFDSATADQSPCDADADSACLADVKCDRPSVERCVNYCGSDANVRRCPPCEYEVPQCWDYSAGSALTSSLVFVAIALLVSLLNNF